MRLYESDRRLDYPSGEDGIFDDRCRETEWLCAYMLIFLVYSCGLFIESSVRLRGADKFRDIDKLDRDSRVEIARCYYGRGWATTLDCDVDTGSIAPVPHRVCYSFQYQPTPLSLAKYLRYSCPLSTRSGTLGMQDKTAAQPSSFLLNLA